MNFDTFSLAAMAHELRHTLSGGRVQRVTQINSLTYSFEIFIHPIRHYLTLSAEPQAPRLHLTLNKSRRGVGHETPLMLVLRKYMRGAKLAGIEQPPYERILYFYFDSPFEPTILAAEMLGTRSNLVLLNAEQTVLGVARLPKGDAQSGQRTLLPNQYYQPPPPLQKLLPAQLTEYTLRQELAEASPEFKLARLLPQILNGVSPLLAKEITFRATGSAETTVGELTALSPLLQAVAQLFAQLDSNAWQPTLAFDEDDSPVAFAPYTLTHLPHPRPTATFSEAVEIYFADAAAGYAVAKAPLLEAIKTARDRLARRRDRLEEDAADLADPEQLKTGGEVILGAAHLIAPGQTELAVDWLPGLVIKLDPALSPSENAQHYFNRYRKAQRAGDEIPAQLEKISLEEQYLDQLEQDLAMAEDRPEIDAIAYSLAEAGYAVGKRGHKKRQKQAVSNYLRLTAPDGAAVWVGKNAVQNQHLTFNRANPDDLWLHARGIPGAHVIIPTSAGLPSEDDVLWAAAVAAYYSRARHDTAVDVDVTVKKYVRAIKGAPPGLVTLRNESTLRVAPLEPEID